MNFSRATNSLLNPHSAVLRAFENLVNLGIPYCHFKSNEHLAEGISGQTDLDILLPREHHAKVVDCLNSAGLKLFSSGTVTRYPAVEDWLGFDPSTGRLAHLHIHWQMIAGEPYLKGYRLPWERQILDDRLWNAEYGIHTASPEMELLLLLTRAALKLRGRSLIAGRLGRPVHGGDLRREYAWLLARVDIARFEQLAGSILPADIVAMMLTTLDEKTLESRQFLAVRRALLRHLASWRTYAPSHASLLRWQRELNRRVLQRLWRRIGILSVARRSPVSGGMIVALIGADGSGKSTQAKALVNWLGWKIDVARVYFGSGDGPMSWHRRLLLAARNVLGRSRVGAGAAARPAKSMSDLPAAKQPTTTRAPGPFKILYALSLALEKRRAIRNAVRARNRGMIVVCDRFPQNQISGYNDGPLLADCLERGFPWGAAARLERRLLAVFSMVVPDLLFKLNVSEAVAAERKADTPKVMIQRKIDAVRSLTFGPGCEIIELDADRPLAEITLTVRRQIWQRL
jgi:thymidylate kinase